VYSFTAAAEREIVRDVIENTCSTGFDCDTGIKSFAGSSDNEKTDVRFCDRDQFRWNCLMFGATCLSNSLEVIFVCCASFVPLNHLYEV